MMDERNVEKPETERGFAEGERVILRPVKEGDLPELARLLAEAPLSPKNVPWTHQRLKKQFEDEKEPGLWKERDKYFAVVRHEGGLVGYLHEREDWNRGMYWNMMHIDAAQPDRDDLGRDLVSAYLAYKQRWHNPLRISFDVLGPEDAKIAWLESTGYQLELTRDRMMLFLGRAEAICTYTWYSEQLLAALSEQDEATAKAS